MKHLTYLITAMMLLAVSQTAQGAVLDSCDQWASYCSGSYCVYNAVWGATGSWSQCINASSCTQWTVTATHPGNGIKSYPNSSYEAINGTTVGQLSSCSSSVSTSPPSGGTYNLSYDFWAPIEVMVWLKWQGAIGPWGSYVTTATIGGRSYDVYKNGYPGFLLQSQTSGGTFDLKAIMDYCVNQGWLSTGGNVEKIQCGYEIVEASNTTFKMNSYSVSYSTGGGSTTTTASSTSTTTTASSTSTTSGGGFCGTCNWYGGEIPVCCNTNTGWGWENSQSCIGCQECINAGQSCSNCSNCGSTTTTTASSTSTTTTAASTSTTTTAASTSTTTTAASTSTTTTASSTSTTSGGGSCDCGTCSWYGSSIPMCCIDVGGWGWQDGGCNRSCVSESICPNN